MTDCELLELAAKAAGIEVIGPVEKYIVQPAHFEGGFIVRNERGGDSCWNPLTDDGDALRLAVKLKIDVFGDNEYRRAEIDNWNCAEYVGADLYAATRRAIVRAAAEIGRSME